MKTLDDLPSTLPVDKFADAEQILVRAATQLAPKDLTDVGLQLVDTIDPDGALPDEAEQRRHRGLTIAERRDGGVEGKFRLSAGAGANCSRCCTRWPHRGRPRTAAGMTAATPSGWPTPWKTWPTSACAPASSTAVVRRRP